MKILYLQLVFMEKQQKQITSFMSRASILGQIGFIKQNVASDQGLTCLPPIQQILDASDYSDFGLFHILAQVW